MKDNYINVSYYEKMLDNSYMYKPKLLKYLWRKYKNRLNCDVLEDINCKYNELSNLFIENNNKLKESINNMQLYIDSELVKNNIKFWQLYKKDNESLLETKKRFFLSLETNDEFVKLKQTGNYILLKKFVQICKDNNIAYWATFGTLLGAVRHNGFIPWDDDIDVAIPIGELEKLKKILLNNNDFCVENICAPQCGIFLPRFIFKNHKSLWMIDLYPRVPVRNNPQLFSDEYLRYQHSLIKDLQMSDIVLMEDSLKYESSINSNHLNEYHSKLNIVKNEYRKIVGNEICNFSEKFEGFVYDIGHPLPEKNEKPYKLKSDIFPIKKIKFGNLELLCPNNYHKCLNELYGDIYSLPNDLLTHVHTNLPPDLDYKKEYDFLKKYEY